MTGEVDEVFVEAGVKKSVGCKVSWQGRPAAPGRVLRHWAGTRGVGALEPVSGRVAPNSLTWTWTSSASLTIARRQAVCEHHGPPAICAVCYHSCTPSFLRLHLPRYPAQHAFSESWASSAARTSLPPTCSLSRERTGCTHGALS
jgi:hypothetical protein